MPALYSFDVFDTAVLRRVAVPSDVFCAVARHIAQTSAAKCSAQFVEDFVAARMYAEYVSRQRTRQDETTLGEIWNVLREFLPNLPDDCGPTLEMDMEARLLLPNRAIAQRIAEARRSGSKVAFISDTYLPEEFIRSQLQRLGLANDCDKVYASSRYGVTKWTGKLFQEVLRRECLPPSELRHIGDNFNADVLAPRRLGIQADHYVDSALNQWERALVAKPTADWGAAARLAGAMRANRLAHATGQGHGLRLLTANFVGPILLVWASWVLAQARQDGVRRLYFAARDCYLLWRAASILAPRFGNIDCRYLKISRQAVFLPSATEISRTGMPWLQRQSEPAALGRLVQRLGLEWNTVADEFAALGQKEGRNKIIATDGEWKNFWAIIQQPRMAERITAQIRECREAALEYFESIGFFDGTRLAIVDLGWFLNVQKAMQGIFKEARKPVPLNGYYLGLMTERVCRSDAGEAIALFYDQPWDRYGFSDTPEIFRRLSLIEKIVGLAPHGTILRYQRQAAEAAAICDPVTAEHMQIVDWIAGEIDQFCKADAEFADVYGSSKVAQELIGGLMTEWFSSPNPSTLELLSKLNFLDEQSNRNEPPRRLVEPWSLKRAAVAAMPTRWRNLMGLVTQQPMWPEASEMQSARVPATLLRMRRSFLAARKTWRKGQQSDSAIS